MFFANSEPIADPVDRRKFNVCCSRTEKSSDSTKLPRERIANHHGRIAVQMYIVVPWSGRKNINSDAAVVNAATGLIYYLLRLPRGFKIGTIMRFLILAILVGFPLAEAVLLYKLAAGEDGHAGWVLAWVIFAAIAGVVLIKQARFSLIARLGQALSQGQFSIAALIDSFRAVIAGLLLIFPGVISDILALVILLIPIREPAFARAGGMGMDPIQQKPSPGSPVGDRVIEGEFRRER